MALMRIEVSADERTGCRRSHGPTRLAALLEGQLRTGPSADADDVASVEHLRDIS
jgi:hypothetical protein